MPDEFGRYELHDLLGRGGMGEVYRAYDTVRDRTVALKLLPKHLAEDESFKIRFRRESQMAARLNEPHIIPIHDFGEIDGTLFIDMRLVEGEDLGTLLSRRGPLTLDTAVSLIGQVAAALDAAHESGLVHRDVKPSNVLLTGITDDADMNPFAYLVDFGIARSSTQEGTALTATSGTIGTVAYMSPERIGGEHGDRRTDIYALACVLYEMLTGRKPFEGELFAIMYAHVNTPPPAVSDLAPDVPHAIDEVVRTGMAKNPDDRYPTAGALALAARQALRAAPGGVRRADRPAPTPPPPSAPVPPPWSASTPHHPGQAPTERRVPTPPASTGPGPGPQWTAPPPATTPTPPGQWPGPGSSGPLPPIHPGPGPQRGKSRRTPILAGVAVLVAAAVAVTLVLALGTGGGSPSAQGSISPGASGLASGTVSHTASDTTGPSNPTTSGPASLHTGPPGTGVTWAHFASFSKLLGTSDNDTSHAFDGATCKVEGPEGSADIPGIVDQVKCTMSAGPVVIYVARFSDAAAVNTYVWKLLSHEYSITPWQESTQARGLELQSPGSGTSLDITTSICGLPNYLVQFYVQDATQSSMTDLHDKFWNSAVFPDVVPPACRADFLGPATGQTATQGATADKQPFVVDNTTLQAFMTRRSSTNTATTVPVPSGSESILVSQTGDVSFWTLDLTTGVIERVGHGTYPYQPDDLGPPTATAKGEVLDNMEHATFVIDGTFSTDHSGNAVAFTDGGNGWGVIKAQPDGNLAPSGSSIGNDRIGLSEAFDFHDGDLLTADCSQQLPVYQCHGNDRVIKYWTWSDALNEFVQSGHAGRTT